MDLSDNGKKYSSERRNLIVNDIVYSDEGNYTCVDGQETHLVGCLFVYGETDVVYCFPCLSPSHYHAGKASFKQNNGNSIKVSSEGTVTFDLSLSFTQSGPSRNNQTVSHYCLKRNDKTILNCGPSTLCSFDDTVQDHWWTVESVETGYTFVLHQAKSTDRGSYKAEVEVNHPKDNSIDTIEKTVHVTCKFMLLHNVLDIIVSHFCSFSV